MRFLIVDDDQYMRELVGSILRKNNGEVVAHANLGDGLRHLMNEEFDIVIFDIHLPGMNGLSAIPIAREICPDICIGVMTSDSDPATRAKALEDGADFFLQKPDDIINVWDVITSQANKEGRAEILNE